MGYIYWRFLQACHGTSVKYKSTAILLCGEKSMSATNHHAPCYDVATTNFSFIAHGGNSWIPTFLAKQYHIVWGTRFESHSAN
jgi:hypothetical protein